MKSSHLGIESKDYFLYAYYGECFTPHPEIANTPLFVYLLLCEVFGSPIGFPNTSSWRSTLLGITIDGANDYHWT